MSLYRHGLRACLAAGLTTGLIALSSQPASAHVEVEPSGTGAGETSVLTFGFHHGCDGEPTTALEIRVPDEVLAAEPIDTDGWSHDVSAAGDRTESIVFTADAPVPDHDEAAVEVQIQVPDVEPGTVLEFPVVQICPEGEAAWVQSTTDGTEPDYPAPAFTVTEGPGLAEEAPAEDASPEATEETEPAASTAEDDGGMGALTWIALGLGAVVLIGGGLFLWRRRSGS